MTVYNGNSKIANIYNGNQKIKEVYYGSTKVYSSGIPIWRFTSDEGYLYLIGEYSSNGIVGFAFNENYYPRLCQISSISGTLGSSESSVSCYDSSTINLTQLRKTGTFDSKTLYQYDGTRMVGTYAGSSGFGVIKDGSVVGDYMLSGLTGYGISYTITLNGNNIEYIGSISAYTYTGTLDTSYLKYWTDNGIE